MTTTQLLNLAPPLLFVLFHFAEALVPARRLPRSIGWRVRGFLWFLVSGALFANAPLLIAGFTAGHHLFDTSALGLWSAIPAVVLANFIGYAWHRLRHAMPLWRVHQLHHAAERLDISGAFMFHPLETIVEALLFTTSSAVILGATVEAAELAGTVGFFCACFQHANIRTPRWLGYVVQRPESHSVHHARGIHAFNYADLPMVDIIFGTFKNPPERTSEVGFYDGASRRLVSLLVGADIGAETAASAGPRTNAFEG
jgi:sterol desaturase/sphingolipid hydroxylase (fatty acid hydroxylase superfamily)